MGRGSGGSDFPQRGRKEILVDNLIALNLPTTPLHVLVVVRVQHDCPSASSIYVAPIQSRLRRNITLASRLYSRICVLVGLAKNRRSLHNLKEQDSRA